MALFGLAGILGASMQVRSACSTAAQPVDV